jgi:hypothetical protein
MKYADGAAYEGNWKNDNFHGFGTSKNENGDVFTGNWRNGSMNG